MTNAGSSPAPRQSVKRTALAGVIGNILEWFDFAVYGFFASAIGQHFFPASDPTAQKLLTFLGFAVGFIGRPVGSLVLGVVGDRIGRRALLTLSVGLMGASTLALGLLPGYATIGIAAPILMVLLRLLQGFSVGGEFTGSMVYTTELASPLWRGLISSSTAAGTTLGNQLGNISALVVAASMSPASKNDWGWRIPFILSAALCLTGWLLRRGIRETEEGERAAAMRVPILESLASDWLPMVRTFGIVALTNAAYYLAFSYAAERRSSASGGTTAFFASNLIALTVVLLAKVCGGWLSDRVGRRKLMIALTVFGCVAIVIAWPIMLTGSPWAFWGAQCLVAVPTGMALGLHGAMLVEIFPLKTRVTSMSFAYSVTLVLSGGIMPLISTWLIDVLGHPNAPAYYIVAYGIIGLIIMLPMKETNKNRLDV